MVLIAELREILNGIAPFAISIVIHIDFRQRQILNIPDIRKLLNGRENVVVNVVFYQCRSVDQANAIRFAGLKRIVVNVHVGERIGVYMRRQSQKIVLNGNIGRFSRHSRQINRKVILRDIRILRRKIIAADQAVAANRQGFQGKVLHGSRIVVA